MRAILIDPEAQTMVEIETEGKLADIHALVADKDGLDQFRIADHGLSWDYGWVDDKGLVEGEPIFAFKLAINPSPIAGRCLVIGVDRESRDNCDARFPLDDLRREITWLGLIKPEVTWVEQPGGVRAVVTYERVRSAS